MLGLGSENGRFAARYKARKSGEEGVVFVIREAARAERFDHEPVAARVEIVEDVGVQPRYHLEHEHVFVEHMVELRRAARLFILYIIERPAVAHDGHGGEVDAGEGVERASARLSGARSQNHVAVKNYAHAESPIIRTEQKGVGKIAARVGIARIYRLLRAGQNYWF